MDNVRIMIAITAGLLFFVTTAAAGIKDISNFRSYSDQFASSGQPNKQQLVELEAAGYQRIVYIAYTDHDNSLTHEDRIVKKLGLEYIHVPVEWSAPTKSDFYLFAGALQREPKKKTLLHCQVNYRASAFAFLYRVLHQGVSVSEAKKDMNSVWIPNETWTQLILEILRDNDVSADCAGCDWTPGKH